MLNQSLSCRYLVCYYTQSNKALMIISTPITLITVFMIPFKLSHLGTYSISIHPMRMRTAVCISAEIYISVFLLKNNFPQITIAYNSSRTNLKPMSSCFLSSLNPRYETLHLQAGLFQAPPRITLYAPSNGPFGFTCDLFV